MKVEIKEKYFEPITITIEDKRELEFFICKFNAPIIEITSLCNKYRPPGTIPEFGGYEVEGIVYPLFDKLKNIYEEIK